MISPLFLVAGVAVLVVGWVMVNTFIRLERAGRSHTVLGVYLGVVLAEALLNSRTASVPVGLFRPTVGGIDFRLPDVFLASALLARLIGGKHRSWISANGAAWAATLVFLATSTVIGFMNHNNYRDIIFDLKSYLYIIGTMVLVAGVPARQLLDRERFRTWLLWITSAASVLLALQVAGIVVNIPLPGAALPRFGDVSSETHSMLVVIGVLGLCSEACSRRPAPRIILASVLLMAAPFAGFQRASFVQLAVTLGVLLIASFTFTWARRVKFTMTDAVIFATVLLIAGGSVLGLAGQIGPLEKRFATTFLDSVKQKTADERVGIFETSKQELGERPAFGWGMGHRVGHHFGWTRTIVVDEVTSHNILLDLALRTGIVGFAAMALAMAFPIVAAIRVWRRDEDEFAAGLCIGVIAGLAGLMGKGFVETAFEKFRIGITFGFLLGVALSAYAAMRTREEAAELPRNKRELLPLEPVGVTVAG
ncbi:MAG: O-Antigen ligase [Acidimicrobiia bacterium]|nr:O-Antigen ligase [Acidimicrobiia bacterium]